MSNKGLVINKGCVCRHKKEMTGKGAGPSKLNGEGRISGEGDFYRVAEAGVVQ